MPDFTMSLANAAITIVPGQSDTVIVNLQRKDNFADAVNLTLTGAPAGVVATFTPASVTGNSSVLKLEVDLTAAQGSYPLVVRGASGSKGKTSALTLQITERPDTAPSVSLSSSAAYCH
ncbi:MAG: hypothetical protein ACRCYY_08690 [Trueperaceae bacterium]